MKIVDTFQNRLKKAMELNNMKQVQLVEKTGIDKTLINKYLSGASNAKQQKITILANALHVNEIWLMGYDVPMEQEEYINNIKKSMKSHMENDKFKEKQYYMCAVYGQISAGQPNWAEECIEGRIPIDPDLMGIVNPEEHFFLRVNGESMNKVIRNGAFALIHKQDVVKDGEIAVVLVNGYDATLKKFTRQGEFIILEPESTDESFKSQVYDKTTPIKILGKYVGKMELN